MHFEIDPTNGLPVYEQVYRQVAFAIANGVISSGDLVPPVRVLTCLPINSLLKNTHNPNRAITQSFYKNCSTKPNVIVILIRDQIRENLI